MFGCIDCAIHVKVRLNCGYGIECVVQCVLVQLLHVLWIKEAMLVICYDIMHMMIDDDTHPMYPVEILFRMMFYLVQNMRSNILSAG